MVSEIKIAPPEKKECTLHSIEEALAEITRLNARGEIAGPVTVICEDGVYPVRQTIQIANGFSLPVTFKPAKNAHPVFDGGLRITGWKKCRLNGKTMLKAALPEDFQLMEDRLPSLFVNGKRKTVASFPKDLRKSLMPEAVYGETDDKFLNGHEGFVVKKGDFSEKWYHPQGIECLVMHLWTDSHLPVESYDPATRVVKFTRLTRCKVDPERTCFVWQNVREKLTEPGEYYYDSIQKELIYFPEKGESADTLEAVIPAQSMLLLLSGTADKNISNVHFEGLTFRHGGAAWPFVGPDGYCFRESDALPCLPNHFFKPQWKKAQFRKTPGGSPQAAIQVPGTVFARHAHDCSFTECCVEHSDWYGIQISGGCRNVRISRCTLTDLGGGGVVINGSSADADADPEDRTSRISVTDCHIFDCGKIFLSAIGVLIGHAFGNLIEHNHIHDLYYSGISCGWVWGYGDSVTRENRIGFNHIHDIGKGVICDMGGIYTLGIQPGTKIYHNLISRVKCRFYGGWGIYTDEGSSHIVIEGNICHDCSREGFHQHYGGENTVRCNISAFNEEHSIALTTGNSRNTGFAFPGKQHTANYTFERNVIVTNDKPFFKGMTEEVFTEGQFYCDMNVYADLSGKHEKKNFAIVGNIMDKKGASQYSFADWQKKGFDLFSVFADPGFRDVKKRDFRLKKDSILKKYHFPDPEITLSGAGIRKKK